MHELIHDIALCIIAAWALGVLAQFFRQPVILAYLVGGFAIGPAGFGLVDGQESVATISELGLIFLLFMIGLEIDLKKIISAGTPILVTAASQILGGTVVGVAFFYLIGFPMSGGKWDALYLGIAAALSSTVIIVKMLYDKRELDTLPGRVTLGLLVLQDLFVIFFLAIQPSLDDLQAGSLLLSLVRVVAPCCEFADRQPLSAARRFSAASRGFRNWCSSARWRGAFLSVSLPRECSSPAKWERSSQAFRFPLFPTRSM